MAGLGLGARCIRGPDWQWEDQDGGLGHVGTVVFIGNQGHPVCPRGTVEVLWDNGMKQNYRVGHGNAYDLRLLDNGPCGVLHSEACCEACGTRGIYGMLWRCATCPSSELCTRCYMLKFHDITHEFIRYVDAEDPGVKVGPRQTATQLEIFGAFKGAGVVRGHDWTWDNQDGGLGAVGRVLAMADWNGQTARSVLTVLWPNKGENMYRLGHKGKVDLTCVTPASGGKVFSQQLPLLGRRPESGTQRFQLGQTVMVAVDIDTLKVLQQGHGGFHLKMADVIGRRGKVHRITEKGDVRVQYPGHPPQEHRWAINPAALRILQSHVVGERVTVTSDRRVVERYHQNTAALDSVLGSTGIITHINSETSVVVDFGGGRVQTVHSGILSAPGQEPEPDIHSLNQRFVRAAALGDLAVVESILGGGIAPARPASDNQDFVHLPDSLSILMGLHKAVGNGFTNVVIAILKFRPDLVRERLQDKTALMLAAHEGHVALISWLLECGADIADSDGAGDTALHYAAIGAKPEAILTLVDKGANVNWTNQQKRSPLHLAVIGRNEEVVKALLKVGANVNLQDYNGETPLHIAIQSSSPDIVDFLLPQAELLLCTGSGLNALHLAANLGEPGLLKRILRRDPAMVNIVTREGAAALHLAARRSIPALLVLLDTPQCDINVQDREGRTVLHWAAERLEIGIIRILLKSRAATNVQDCVGNTAAHLVMSQNLSSQLPLADLAITTTSSAYTSDLEDILETEQVAQLRSLGLDSGQMLQLGLLLLLLSSGDSQLQHIVNQQGLTPIDLVDNLAARRFLQDCLRKPVASSDHEYAEILESQEPPTSEPECSVCSEPGPLETFLPCGHRVVCGDCARRVKKCLTCHVPLEKKATDAETRSIEERERLKSLELKVQDLEDQFLCGICMERKRNVAFLCGHGACTQCTRGLDTCHMCRTAIERKIPLY